LLVHLQVAEPARTLGLVRAEHANVNLVQIGAAHIDADRQGGGGKHAVDGLDFIEDLIQGIDDTLAGIFTGDGKVLSLAVLGGALQQGGHIRPLAGSLWVHLDGVGKNMLAAVQIRVDIRIGHEFGPLVKPVTLLAVGAERNGTAGVIAQRGEFFFGHRQRGIVFLGRAVTDVDQITPLADIGDR